MKQLTPRTDAAEFGAVTENGPCVSVVLSSISHQLETELNETKAALEREQQDCAALRQMVRELRDAMIQAENDIIGDCLPARCYEAITKANQLLP